jgi:hypothetical protein
MLVCNVSQLRSRAAIAADVAELAAALDAPGSGNVIFTALVDDPASGHENVDAFLGQIIRELASASDTVSTAGFVYAVTVAETVTATDLVSISTPVSSATVAEAAVAVDSVNVGLAYAVAVVEAASAAELVSASIISGSSFDGMLALDGPIIPGATAPTVIYIEG